GSYRIGQKHPEKKRLLANVTSFFQGSVFRLQRAVSAAIGGSASLDRDLTGVDQIKNYDDSTVVRMNVHFKSQGMGEFAALMAALGFGMPTHLEDSRSVPFKVTYSLWYRQESDYVPRLSDPRIGYFTQDFFSVSRFGERDRTGRFIARFDVRKKNPGTKMSEPVEPIVWYVDTSVPKKYRPAVRFGILAWNSSFERIGIKNAIVVKDAPDNDPDWDHADGRHNVVRWSMSKESAYAVAWFRMDPLSGEVLNASVSIDANFPTVMLREYTFTLNQGTAEQADLSRRALLRVRPGELDAHDLLVSGENPKVVAARKELEQFGWNRGRCEYAGELARSAAMGWAILDANDSNVAEEDYMFSFLANLVMHEIGHCLGLRHNFAGSTQLDLQDLLDDDKVRSLGLSASVMDYAPVNTPAVLRGSGVFFNEGVGPYDDWAIEYGYTPIVAFTPEAERYELGLIARRSGEPGHIYLTDEDANGVNPLAVTFDLSADTLAWLETEIAGIDVVKSYAINKLTKTGEGYGPRNRLILSTYLRNTRSSMMATRFIGGIEMRRQHKGDVSEQPTLYPVDPDVQRRAMKFVIEQTLMKASVDLPPKVMLGLNMDPNDGSGGYWTAPLRSIVGGNQIAVLATLMSGRKADQIIENDFKLEGRKDRYTVAEHYNTLLAAVFQEVGQNRNVTAMRRDLQRFMVEGLITQAGARDGYISDDVRMVASQALVGLKKRFDSQASNSGTLDELTVLHLKDVSDRIGRYLKRQVVGDR
ncbi:MAG: zinc-dependent metalloprotease, partial [Armatimonadetes bacterium]|nr:zinc-dependent metalloprotease [Armatimonadota bacterium]